MGPVSAGVLDGGVLPVASEPEVVATTVASTAISFLSSLTPTFLPPTVKDGAGGNGELP